MKGIIKYFNNWIRQILSFDYLLIAGLLLMIYPTLQLLLAIVYLLIGLNISVLVMPLAILLTPIVYISFFNNTFVSKRMVVKIFFWCLVSLLPIFFYCGLIYDYSADGQLYHQEAIIQLKNGWNPFYESVDGSIPHAIWLNHYPKSVWINAASIYQLTENIQHGKILNYIVLLSAFLIGIYFFKKAFKFSTFFSLLLSGLLSLNPITIAQLNTFYFDGLSASCTLILIYGLILFTKKDFQRHAAGLIVCSIFLLNIKFTNPVYYGLFLTVFCLVTIIQRKNFLVKKIIPIAVIPILVSVLVISYNPYITNTLQHGHPFYPVMGSKKIDLLSVIRPDELDDKNQLEKFYIAQFKTPFDLSTLNLKYYFGNYGNFHFNGFGPLFKYFLIASLLFLFLLWIVKRGQIKTLKYFTVVIGTLIFSVLINPGAWVTRYIFQLWYVPITVMVLGAILLRNKTSQKLIKVVLIGLLSFQFIHIAANNIIAVKSSLSINKQLQDLKLKNVKLKIRYNGMASTRLKLNEFGLNYEVVDSLACDEPDRFAYSRAEYCFN